MAYDTPNNQINRQSNRRSPLSINTENINNSQLNTIRQNRVQTEAYDKTKGPYGVRFDEMESHAKSNREQLKNDLEYLMSLKNGRHGDMTQQEWEEYNRKLHYMNDVRKYFLFFILI